MNPVDIFRVRDTSNYELTNIDINDVLAIYYQKDFSVLHTDEGKFLLSITEAGIEEISQQYGFTKADVYTHVNLRKVTRIHSELSVILFSDVQSVKESRSKKYLEVYLHRSFMKKFKDIFGKEKDLAYKAEKTKNSTFIFKRNFADEL